MMMAQLQGYAKGNDALRLRCFQGLGGWRANSNLENSDGGISDEYSDDDDPGVLSVYAQPVLYSLGCF